MLDFLYPRQNCSQGKRKCLRYIILFYLGLTVSFYMFNRHINIIVTITQKITIKGETVLIKIWKEMQGAKGSNIFLSISFILFL